MDNHGANSGGCGGAAPPDWRVCRDERYGFLLCYPPEWRSTTEAGRCTQFQKGGQGELPSEAPEVDVFVFVQELRDPPSGDVLHDFLFPGDAGTEKRGVEYEEHRKSLVAGLPAVRARFRSFGDQVNWGIEYAVRKQKRVLHIYISRPDPETENLFEKMVATLQW